MIKRFPWYVFVCPNRWPNWWTVAFLMGLLIVVIDCKNSPQRLHSLGGAGMLLTFAILFSKDRSCVRIAEALGGGAAGSVKCDST